MPRIRSEVTIDRSPEEVWAVLGDFSNVDWVPALSSATVEGNRRVCTLPDGAEIHEDLERDDAALTFSYAQVKDPLRLRRSTGTVAVLPADSGAHVVWDADVEFAEPEQEAQFLPVLQQGYGGALQALKQHVEGAGGS
jgi:Polyketide cyclase / dehydrase and lipid transport